MRLALPSCLVTLSLLAACAGPAGDAPADRAAVAGDPASAAPADDDAGDEAAAATATGPHGARFVVDGTEHAFRSGEGHVWLNAIVDVPEVQQLTLETYTPENSLYAKADLYVPTGTDPSGEYQLGRHNAPENLNVVGRGQLLLAIETDPEAGRRLLPSGAGRLRLHRDGDAWIAEFEFTGDGMFRPADAPAITGELRVVPAD